MICIANYIYFFLSRTVQNFIVGSMDRFFYNHGKRVASHPYWYIVICLVQSVIKLSFCITVGKPK